MKTLDTGIKNVRNVSRYTIGEGSMEQLPSMISARKQQTPGPAIFFIDQFFKSRPDILGKLGVE
ncbi:MAG: alcohol dehydrogenase, partial [bacterium]|nr:alcohol dehydrogenase [bacterium]